MSFPAFCAFTFDVKVSAAAMVSDIGDKTQHEEGAMTTNIWCRDCFHTRGER
jgi:hypothetical protein